MKKNIATTIKNLTNLRNKIEKDDRFSKIKIVASIDEINEALIDFDEDLQNYTRWLNNHVKGI